MLDDGTLILTLTIILLSLVAYSCGDDSPDRSGSTASPIHSVVDNTASPESATPPGLDGGGAGIPGTTAPSMASLETLVEAFPDVVVGVVQDGSELKYREYTYGSCGAPYTVFAIKVESVVYSPDWLTHEIPLAIYGGPDGPDQENCVSVDPVPAPKLEAGSRLLLFLLDQRELGTPGYLGIRFEIDEAGRIVPTGEEVKFPAMAAVSGVTAEDAASAVDSPDPEAALKALAHVTLDEASAKILAAIKAVESTPPSETVEATASTEADEATESASP